MSRRPPILPEHVQPDMRLPAGATCGNCVHIDRCAAMFGHIPEDRACDWSPSRFRPSASQPASQPASLRLDPEVSLVANGGALRCIDLTRGRRPCRAAVVVVPGDTTDPEAVAVVQGPLCNAHWHRRLQDYRDGLTRCVRCGCTDRRACPGGCAWIPVPSMDDVCSSCGTTAELRAAGYEVAT